jgi:hypothetical protein
MAEIHSPDGSCYISTPLGRGDWWSVFWQHREVGRCRTREHARALMRALKRDGERNLSECRECHHELPLLAPLDVARQLDAILSQPYSEHILRIRVHQLAQQLHGLCAVCAPMPVDPSQDGKRD